MNESCSPKPPLNGKSTTTTSTTTSSTFEPTSSKTCMSESAAGFVTEKNVFESKTQLSKAQGDVDGVAMEEPLSKENLEDREMPVHPIVKVLLEQEPPVRMSHHSPVENETEETLMSSFVQLADHELKDVITWAKHVPGK